MEVAGNIGTSVVTALTRDDGVHVTGVARRRPAWSPPGTSFVAADIRSPGLSTHLRGADALVHLAWAFQPTHDPATTWDVNVRGGIATFEAAAAAGVRTLVYVSSVGAYSAGAGQRVSEDWPTHSLPTVAYGREKSYLERFLDAFELRHPEMRVVRLRPCFVFQRAAASSQGRIFAGPWVPRSLLRPGRLRVLAVPAGLRFQAVHADDVGAAVRLAVHGPANGAYNVATDDVIDAAALGEIFQARVVSVPGSVAKTAVGAGWRLHLVPADDQLVALLLSLPTLDSGRARRELGWQPVHSGRAALTEMLTALADGAGGPTPPLHPGRFRAG